MPARRLLCFIVLLVSMGAVLPVGGQPLDLILPTDNDALLRGDEPAFYQHTVRYFKGKRSLPWEGGQYGYVRNLKETRHGLVKTRFHEGLDIKPVRRDHKGEPLDAVRAIDDGQVVYINRVERHSSYGHYVVVEHWWSGSPFYSLYAHLGRVQVRKGQRVRQGERLATLGYTGRGIDRDRAHVHFEINMLLSDRFEDWYDERDIREPNYHGLYNGLNLRGIDAARLYLALQNNPNLTIEDFLAEEEAFFKVLVPASPAPDVLRRYPWLLRRDGKLKGASWEISFTRAGLPIAVAPSSRPVAEPLVSWVQPSRIAYNLLTSGVLTNDARPAALAKRGRRYLDLLTLGDTDAPVPALTVAPLPTDLHPAAAPREGRNLGW